ncbi:MAG: hypothetical protein NC395_10000 [Prevotella sp.]|nr:hypothetical protein [Prevotella sp.]
MRSPMKATRAGGSLNLFFMEMIIVLLFFGIASAVILNAFAAADRVSGESGRLERMSFCAQSAAEIFSASGDLEDTAKRLFGDVPFGIPAADTSEGGSETLTVPLSEDCEYSPGDPPLFMTMSVSGEEYGGGRLKTLHITFEDENGGELYSIVSGAYLPAERTVSGNE